MNDPRQQEGPWPRLVVGLTLLTVGILFWLDHNDRLDAHELMHWWPVAAIVLGAAYLPQRRWDAAVVWMAIG